MVLEKKILWFMLMKQDYLLVHCANLVVDFRVFQLVRYLIFILCLMYFNSSDAVVKSFVSTLGVLVIGNQDYVFAKLDTPLNDASSLGGMFRPLANRVDIGLDLKQSEMYEVVDNFFRDHKDTDALIIYYAGHAVQVNGRNFLIPVDMPKNSPDVLSHLFDIRYLMDKLTQSKATTKIVILDACRDTLFAKSPNAASGLAELKAPPGTLIAFSTMPGATAEDGEGENSPYTTALLELLFKPNIKIEDAFKEVRRRVMQLTDGAQVPSESSLLLEDFYMVKRGAAGTAPAGIKGSRGTPALAQRASSASASKPVLPSACSRLMTKMSMGLSPLTDAEQKSLAGCQ